MMKSYFNCTDRASGRSSLLRSLFIILGIGLFACDKQLIYNSSGIDDPTFGRARLSGEALFSLSYEIEALSFNRIKSGNKKSKELAFAEIASRPRLERQAVQFSLFADGSYEMEVTPMAPRNLHLLPEAYRKKLGESVLPDKIVTKNGVVRMYDKQGKETSSYTLKTDRFGELAARIIKSGANIPKEQLAAEFIDSPLISRESILNLAREKNAEVTENNELAQVKFDLSQFANEATGDIESLSGKYTIQYYDFKNNRFVGEKMHDKGDNKLLYQSALFYDKDESGNRLRKILSESYNLDVRTGVETIMVNQTFYDNMRVVYNL